MREELNGVKENEMNFFTQKHDKLDFFLSDFFFHLTQKKVKENQFFFLSLWGKKYLQFYFMYKVSYGMYIWSISTMKICYFSAL